MDVGRTDLRSFIAVQNRPRAATGYLASRLAGWSRRDVAAGNQKRIDQMIIVPASRVDLRLYCRRDAGGHCKATASRSV